MWKLNKFWPVFWAPNIVTAEWKAIMRYEEEKKRKQVRAARREGGSLFMLDLFSHLSHPDPS